MGEIAEALKRARAEREAQEQEARTSHEPPAPEGAPDSAPAPAAPGSPEATAGSAPSPLTPVPPTTRAPLVPPDSVAPAAPEGERTSRSAERAQVALREDEIAQIEHHRHLALRIRDELERRGSRSVAIVSALRNEGKTTVARTVAAALASLTVERCVAIVDLDLRNPSVAQQFGLQPRVGMEWVLLGRAGLDEACISIAQPALDVYAVVQPQRAAHELLAAPRFAEVMEALESRYRIVVLDTPPTLLVPDASLILNRGSACVAVARRGESRVRRFTEMLEMLPAASMIGKVLNSAPTPRHQREYYRYGYVAEDEQAKDTDKDTDVIV